MSDYKKILDESLIIYCLLSSKKFNGISLSDSLKIPNFGISLWQIYEVILTIHCFPRKYPSFFRLYLHGILRRLLSRIKHIVNFNNYNNKEYEKLTSYNNILFLGFTQYLAKENFEPISDILNSDGIYNPLIITDKILLEFDVDKKSIVNINRIHNDDILSFNRTIMASIQQVIIDLKFNISKNDLDSKELKNLKIALDFIRTYSEETVPRFLAVAYHIFLKYPPKAIVSIDVADPRSRIFTLIANHFKIPVIQLQAGPIDEDCIEWRFCYDDLILANGCIGQLALEEHGILKDKILTLGSAKHDKVLEFKNYSSFKLRENFKIENKLKIVLLLSSYTELSSTSPKLSKQLILFNNIFNSIIKGIINQKNLVLIIKPHPLESIDRLKAISNKKDRIYITSIQENTTKLIACADAVITFGSTATLDAILLNKLTICPQFSDWMGDYFQKSGAVAVPKNEKEIEFILNLINKNLTNDLLESFKLKRLDFLQNVTTDLGYGATRRIVEKIYEVVAKSNKL
jgi:hypothetical protein